MDKKPTPQPSTTKPTPQPTTTPLLDNPIKVTIEYLDTDKENLIIHNINPELSFFNFKLTLSKEYGFDHSTYYIVNKPREKVKDLKLSDFFNKNNTCKFFVQVYDTNSINYLFNNPLPQLIKKEKTSFGSNKVSTTNEHEECKFIEKEFKVLENNNILFNSNTNSTSWLLESTEDGECKYQNEKDVSSLFLAILKDVIKACGLDDKLKLKSEIGITMLIPDIWIPRS